MSYPTSLYVLTYIHVYVDLQFYSWFNFFFLLFQTNYHTLPYRKTKEKKFKPKIKLNQKIYNRTLYLVYNNIKEKIFKLLKVRSRLPSIQCKEINNNLISQ